MQDNQIVAGPMPSAAPWQPLRVALAWRIANGDNKLVEWARTDPLFDAPIVMAGCLAEEMVEAGCIVKSPFHHFGPTLGVLAKPFEGRFQQLAADFDARRLRHLQELPGSELPQDWLRPDDIRDAKVFRFVELRTYLADRVDQAWVEIRHRISNGELPARGVAVDRGFEGPAGDMPPSALTETTMIGLHDGLVHQSHGSTRAWTSVTVFWPDFVKCCSVPTPAPSGQCTSQIEAIRQAFHIVFKAGVVPPGVTAKERNSRIGDHIVKGGGKRPGTRTFQRAFAPEGRARTQRR